ncbi:DUF3131 domain-containing protein [Sulfitobacter sp. F26204]|uniref:DUF3131 domain-containing protein n=1 Tax=Sulfitobacter sp. F26204 TaxID=2996014 RepID=UPI00225E3959|nr:DUF3131 domain-containing protein [Sulfitobacter sp. F26204]MCX7560510.1 DUF3131 domain-containing protein [Sulfitobacter sp. F26204]
MALLQTSLKAHRGSLMFLIGLILAAALAVSGDGLAQFARRSGSGMINLSAAPELSPLSPRAVSAMDMDAARMAWRYIAENTDPDTGLVTSVAGFPSTTLWDQGSYLLGLVSAYNLGVIDQEEFDRRADQFLTSMAALPLFDGKLPNKAYDTRSLAMVDYDNSPAPAGIGWSAIDLGRLLIAFRVLESHVPSLRLPLRELLKEWDLAALSEGGELMGALRVGNEIDLLQEGRIGYEQYAARGMALWGLDVTQAISAARAVRWEALSGVDVPVDLRRRTSFGAISPTLSEPYMLQGLEMGLNSEGQHLAARVYLAQEARFHETGQPTMVSEDHINRSPSFLYNTVYSDGRPWAVLTEDGEHHEDLRTVSLKAVFAWNALYGTEYTTDLRGKLVPQLGDTEAGWSAGWYTATDTANDIRTLNTNAVILEAIHYIAQGPLL